MRNYSRGRRELRSYQEADQAADFAHYGFGAAAAVAARERRAEIPEGHVHLPGRQHGVRPRRYFGARSCGRFYAAAALAGWLGTSSP